MSLVKERGRDKSFVDHPQQLEGLGGKGLSLGYLFWGALESLQPLMRVNLEEGSVGFGRPPSPGKSWREGEEFSSMDGLGVEWGKDALSEGRRVDDMGV